MSERSFNRQRTRRGAAEARRAQLRRRRAGLAAGAAVGAFALAAPAAQAANLVVNTKTDAVADACTTAVNGCTLRDAVTVANGNSQPDTITFASGLSGTIRLTQGQLALGGSMTADGNPVTIQGPGAGLLKVSGDADASNTHDAGDSRIFSLGYISASAHPTLNLSGLTLSGGYTSAGTGGAVYIGKYAHLSVDHTTITGNATTNFGGAIGGDGDKYSSSTISNSTISNNTAVSGGAISQAGPVTVDHSTISGNKATAGSGGGINFESKYGPLQVTDSVISGNSATGNGGGLSFTPFFLLMKYTPSASQITNTTISGNSAASGGAGVSFYGVTADTGSLTISRSTISGNPGGASSYGGGIRVGGEVFGTFRTVDSTISGNSAGAGGGVSFHGPTTPSTTPQVGPSGSISFDNSTIASNTATTKGGGFYLGVYGPSGGPYTSAATVPLTSTIIGGNKANGAGNDLDRANTATSGGFGLSFSLVQAPGDGVASQASSIFNTDPQLGALGNSGGPTQTQVPAASSPAIDAGKNPLALTADQRGAPRTSDLSPANVGDGTDIGAVEVPLPASNPPPAEKAKCKKHKKHKKRSASSAKKKHKKCKKHKKHKKH